MAYQTVQPVTPIPAERQWLESLAEALGAVCWEASLDGRQIQYISPRIEVLVGYSADQCCSQTGFWDSWVHPPDRQRVSDHAREAANGSTGTVCYRILAADGRLVWIRQISLLVRDEQGQPCGLRGLMFDVSVDKEVEAERARFRAAVEQAHDAVIMTRPDGAVIYVNPAFERITGYSGSEIISERSHPRDANGDQLSFVSQIREAILSGQGRRGEMEHRTRDGRIYTWDATVTPVFGQNDDVASYVAVSQDVTDRRELEQRLRQAQKMEAIGRLAGGVAHDFNNLLTVILGHCDRLVFSSEESTAVRRGVEAIKRAAERAASLTQQLLAFSRRQVLAPKVLNLSQVAENLEPMLRRLIGEDIELVWALAPGLWRVKADPGQMEQVMMNLVLNARDAMPQGGKLTIETMNLVVSRDYARKREGLRPGSYAVLKISDTGHGMDADTRSHVFEPFFTTKERGKGTGLGLSTVYGIVKQSGGYIWVDSEPGCGATFQIFLPRVLVGAEEAAHVDATARRAPSGSETVLLVEDEDAVRQLLHDVLEARGYTVLEARGGDEAIRLAEERQDPIQLVVTDVVMPSMSGYEMAQRLRQLRPDIKVLFMSGYTDHAAVHQGVREAGTAFLGKPFRPDSLARKVREIIEGPGPSRQSSSGHS